MSFSNKKFEIFWTTDRFQARNRGTTNDLEHPTDRKQGQSKKQRATSQNNTCAK